jgi:two-component system cell cycle sensor histidine kinase/response regulator CckA
MKEGTSGQSERDALSVGGSQFARGSTAADAADTERQLVEADRVAALGSLAAGIAHQINNALTYMRLGVGRLLSLEQSLQPVTPLRQHRLEMLHDVREGIVRIERINNELIHFSQLDRGAVGPVRLVDLIEAVSGTIAHEIQHRARLVCDHGETPMVRGNEAALRQVFLNLIMNAAQSIADGEAHLNEIRISSRTDAQGRAVVDISDTGAGIAPELLGRIFEPFFTTRPPGQGIGLGLAICRDLVTFLGGEITVESVVGEGTTMRVTLPPAGATATVVASERVVLPPTVTVPAGGGRRRILVVDDEQLVARAVAHELERERLEVLVAESGREALEILERDRDFDLVLCDLMMPEMSGPDLYEAARRLDSGLIRRFAFMSGGAFTERAARFLEHVPNPRIAKPFHVRDLLALVHGAVARRAVEPPAEGQPAGAPVPPLGSSR